MRLVAINIIKSVALSFCAVLVFVLTALIMQSYILVVSPLYISRFKNSLFYDLYLNVVYLLFLWGWLFVIVTAIYLLLKQKVQKVKYLDLIFLSLVLSIATIGHLIFGDNSLNHFLLQLTALAGSVLTLIFGSRFIFSFKRPYN